MNQPQRLLEETNSEFERALLLAGRSYRCGPAVRAQALGALGLVSTAAIAGTATVGPLARLLQSKLATALTALGVATSVPVAVWLTQPPPVAQSTLQPFFAKTVLPSPAKDALSSLDGTPANGPASTDTLESSVTTGARAHQPVKVPSSSAQAPASRQSSAPKTSPSLTEEIALLDQARARLSSGNARGALATLNDHAQRFPGGRLALEAEVLRIDALARAGQRQAARSRARAFLNRHSTSALAARVQRFLSE